MFRTLTVVLLSDCCARGGRLRTFRKADECEVLQAIKPAMLTEEK